jgi:hypothetical protein
MPMIDRTPDPLRAPREDDFPPEMLAEQLALAALEQESLESGLSIEELLKRKAEAERARKADLQVFAADMVRLRDAWITARIAAGVDARWHDDEDQYNGVDSVNRATNDMVAEATARAQPMTSAQTNNSEAVAHRSTVFINQTRQKTNTGEARLSDIVLPTDERNFAITPTPDPRLARALKSRVALIDPATGRPQQTQLEDSATGRGAVDATGQPLMRDRTEADAAREVMMAALDAAQAMERKIYDQLVECDYAAEVRKMLHDAAVFGVGVLRGPIVTNRTRKAWVRGPQQGRHVLQVIEETRPTSRWVPVWNVFPDPECGDDVQNGQGIFERELLPRREVQALAEQPYYDADAIRQVLLEGPRLSRAFTTRDSRDQRILGVASSNLFEVFTYTGDLEVDRLRALGALGIPEDLDPLARISGCLVMINGSIVKAYLNPIPSGGLPYDFFPWEKVTGTVWAVGIPYLMRHQQRVMNAAWRMMMDNSGLSAGPQVILRRGAITPADGRWVLHSRKIWYANDDVVDVEKAFQVVNIDNNQTALANIIRMAEDLADKETGQPMLVQGERGSAPDTVGGMQMLLNNANIGLRRLVKQYDDYVTKRHVRRYYDYNMEHDEDDAIKGDFDVHAKGSGGLLVRDVQNQAYLQLVQLAAPGTPWSAVFHARKLMEKALAGQHIAASEVLKTEDEMQRDAEVARASTPPDPRVMVAEARVTEAQARAQGDISEIELRREIAAQNFSAAIAKLELQREVAMLEYANREKMSLEKVRQALTAEVIRANTKKQLQATEIALKMNPANPTNQGI